MVQGMKRQNGISKMKSINGNTGTGSCFADMFCDAPAQYGDYSELEKCPMWGMWVKEGGE
jgi:hypothetical protein